jgi:hypothetical protein
MTNLSLHRHSGSMLDKQHEGYPSRRIDEIYQKLTLAPNPRPNLYLINAGTNDCLQNYLGMNGTIGRLENLLLLAWERSERATIILSTVLPSDTEKEYPGANARATALDKDIRSRKSSLSSGRGKGHGCGTNLACT